MKGQVSTELLIIVGLVLLIFIPVLVLVYLKANDATQQVASYQAELAVFRLAYLANSVGSLGTNSSTFTDVYVPKDVQFFGATPEGNGGTVEMKINTPQGENDITEIVRYPVDTVTLADNTTAGSWIRVRVASEYDNGQAKITIEKVK